MKRPNNRAADLLDLSSRLVNETGEKEFHLRTDVRVGQAEVEPPSGRLVARRVFISLDLDGFDIRPGVRLGEPLRGAIVTETENTTETVRKANLTVDAGASVDTAGKADARFNIGAGGGAESIHKSQSKTIIRTEMKEVKALGGNRWEIKSASNQPLDGTYVTAEESLCVLEKVDGANRHSVVVNGFIKKRDIDFIPDGVKKLGNIIINKNKIINAFLVKRLSEISASNNEVVYLSEQELGDD